MTGFAVLFALMGMAVAGLALCWQDWAWLLIWPALNLLALAAAYGRWGPALLGKTASGQVALWARFFFLPFHLYILGIWHLARALGREPAFAFVTEDLILSRRLLAHEIPPGVVNWVDLCAEFADPPQARNRTNYIFLPAMDAGFPDPADLNRAIDRLRPGTTLVHCAQGHGRTALFALALLARRGQIQSIDQGMALIGKARPGAALNRHQDRWARQVIETMIRNRQWPASPALTN